MIPQQSTLTPHASQLLEQALQLSEKDREEIAARLFDSLVDEGIDEGWEAEWAAEIKKRVEDVRSGRAKGIPLEEAMQMILDDNDDSSDNGD